MPYATLAPLASIAFKLLVINFSKRLSNPPFPAFKPSFYRSCLPWRASPKPSDNHEETSTYYMSWNFSVFVAGLARPHLVLLLRREADGLGLRGSRHRHRPRRNRRKRLVPFLSFSIILLLFITHCQIVVLVLNQKEITVLNRKSSCWPALPLNILKETVFNPLMAEKMCFVATSKLGNAMYRR